MKTTIRKNCFIALLLVFLAAKSEAITLTNPIVFVTQLTIPRELNGTVSNTFHHQQWCS